MHKPHEPTPELRGAVQAMSAHGIRQEQIAEYVGITKPTLHKYYKEELVKGKVNMLMEVSRALHFNAVDKNNVTAQIFILKTQGGWRESDKDDFKPEQEGAVGKIQIEVLDGKASVKPEGASDD